MLISLNLKGGECFFPTSLGWSVIPPNLKKGECYYPFKLMILFNLIKLLE